MMQKKFKAYPYRIGRKLPVPLAISAMLAVEIMHAKGDEERSRVVHRYAHHIADAIGNTER